MLKTAAILKLLSELCDRYFESYIFIFRGAFAKISQRLALMPNGSKSKGNPVAQAQGPRAHRGRVGGGDQEEKEGKARPSCAVARIARLTISSSRSALEPTNPNPATLGRRTPPEPTSAQLFGLATALNRERASACCLRRGWLL